MIEINELRRLAQAANALHDGDVLSWIEGMQRLQGALLPDDVIELLGRLEAAEKERDALRAKVEQMERQEPAAWLDDGTCRAGSDSTALRVVTKATKQDMPASVAASFSVPLYTLPGAQPAPSLASGDVSLISEGKTQPAPSVPECPYPCGWRNLLKYAIEDGAYLARSINEDDPVTENARAVTMRMVMRLRDVLMAVNNAAPEAKP